MLYWLWLIGKLFCKHLFYRPYEFQYFIFYSWEIFWDYFTFPWTINNLFVQFVPMTGILENHIIFMILESFLGTVLPSLLVAVFTFRWFLQAVLHLNTFPFSCVCLLLRFQRVCLEEAAGTAFIENVQSHYIFDTT